MTEERDALETADFVLDLDEYTVELEQLLKTDSARFPPASDNEIYRMVSDRNFFRVTYAFYLQLRGAYTLIHRPDGKREAEFSEMLTKIREMASGQAEFLASRYYLRRQLIRPEWVKMIEEELAVHPDPVVAAIARQIIVKPVLDPSIHPIMNSVDERYELTLPIMMRSFLKQMGTIWANWRSAADKMADVTWESLLRQSAEDLQTKDKNLVLLAHCWFMRDEFHPVAMPYPHFTSGSAFMYASNVAYLQVLFIVLHEIAHVVKGHLAPDWRPGEKTRETFEWLLSLAPNRPVRPLLDSDLSELEADFFAFGWLRGMAGRGSDASVFAVISLLDFLQMFDATASLVFADEGRGENMVQSEGLAADRVRVSQVAFAGMFASASEKAIYEIFRQSMVVDYLSSLKGLRPADVDSFIAKRYYYV